MLLPVCLHHFRASPTALAVSYLARLSFAASCLLSDNADWPGMRDRWQEIPGGRGHVQHIRKARQPERPAKATSESGPARAVLAREVLARAVLAREASFVMTNW
jgi:hypothetical protein